MYKLLHIESGEYVYKHNNGSLYLPTAFPAKYLYVCEVALWKDRNSIHNIFIPKIVNKFQYNELRYKHRYLTISDIEYLILNNKTKILFEIVEAEK